MESIISEYREEERENPIKIEKSDLVVIVGVDEYSSFEVRKGLNRIIELLNPSFLTEDINKKIVLLKPSLLAPTKNTFTNKIVVEEVATFFKERGCKQIYIGDSTMTKSITTMAHKRSGMSEIAEKFGNPIINFFEEELISVSHSSFRADDLIRLPKAVVDADIIVNLPKMKTHNGYIFTGAIKNFFGLLVDKIIKHRRFKDKIKFQQMLGDIHQAVLATGKEGKSKIVLHIMDGIVGMEGKGPRSGKLRSFNCLIGSFSPVAVDTLAYTLMGGNPMHLETIRSLAERNSWPGSMKDLNIIGDDWQNFKQKVKLPSLKNLQNKRTTGSFVERIATYFIDRFHPIIKIDKKKCILCMACAKHCPVQAISKNQKKNKMILDQKICISCFCCGESCENDAIKSQIPIKKSVIYLVFILILIIGGWILVLFLT
ncbi:MAG: DUF362 domain-containing protein [Promethearchaeota archaeon]